VLAENPTDVEARLGEASVHASAGRTEEELRLFREVLRDRPDRLDVRAQLMAAEMDAGRWTEARSELQTMLRAAPEDPRLRFLHSVALDRTGAATEAARELGKARSLGLTFREETALCGHLGLPAPSPRAPPESRPAPLAPRPARGAIRSPSRPAVRRPGSKPAGRKRK
ncbi:MAG: tetratricopeptide repeat protein, partial [Thermoplasmata archaeon]|nr:tetratricopeptide repeat protein [Thermoplasmata archaeon]